MSSSEEEEDDELYYINWTILFPHFLIMKLKVSIAKSHWGESKAGPSQESEDASQQVHN